MSATASPPSKSTPTSEGTVQSQEFGVERKRSLKFPRGNNFAGGLRPDVESHIILNLTMNRILRVILLLIWIELGFALILLPWSEIWEMNFFLFQYPVLGFLIKNAFFRGAISGLGVMNVLLALESFRRPAATAVSRT